MRLSKLVTKSPRGIKLFSVAQNMMTDTCSQCYMKAYYKVDKINSGSKCVVLQKTEQNTKVFCSLLTLVFSSEPCVTLFDKAQKKSLGFTLSKVLRETGNRSLKLASLFKVIRKYNEFSSCTTEFTSLWAVYLA